MRFALAMLAWLAIFVVVRAVALDADPPVRLPNGARGQELWAEGAAKAQEARNWALFGVWQTHAADGYQFWRAQSPVWVYSLAGFLKAFGVSTIAHRAHSIAVSALGFALLLLHGRARLGRVAWHLLALFLACNFYYIHYTRVGLIEPMVNLFSIALLYCCARALARPLWLIGATWALALAVFSKMSGLFLLPVLALSVVAAALGQPRRGQDWLLIAANGAVVLIAVVLFTSSEAYRQRAVWNIAHMAYNHDGATEVDTTRIQLTAMLGRLLEWHRWRVAFFPLFPVAATLGALAIIYTLHTALRRRRLADDALAVVWFGAAFGSLLFTASTYVRFHLVLFPPVALLGARGFDLVWNWLERARAGAAAPRMALSAAMARWGLTGAVLLSFAYANGEPYRDWYARRTYVVRDVNRKVERLVGPVDAVFIGMWAPWLMFDTPYKFYTVRSYFNVSKASLAQLGVTHLLLRKNDLSGSYYRKRLPAAFASRRKLKHFRVKGERLTLYALERPAR